MYDENDGAKDEFLGKCKISLSEVIKTRDDFIDKWFKLKMTDQNQSKGGIRLQIHWLTIGSLNPDKPIVSLNSVQSLNYYLLSIYLDSISDLGKPVLPR